MAADNRNHVFVFIIVLYLLVTAQEGKTAKKLRVRFNGCILTPAPNAIGLERGCVEDQPQQLRKTGLLNMPDA